MITLLDSYSEANYSGDYFLGVDNVGPNKIIASAQSFTCPQSINLWSAKFYLNKTGSPGGNAVARIYNISGSSGTNAVPTGSPLATSGSLAVSSLTGSKTLRELLFTGANQIALVAGTVYAIVFEYSAGDTSNYVEVGTDTTSPTAPGNNAFNYTVAWQDDASTDMIFYVYGGRQGQGIIGFE